jgi:hypothetical protein
MINQNKSGNANSKDIRLIEQMMESVIRKRDHHYDKAKQLKTKSQIQEHKANAEFYDSLFWILKDHKRLKTKEISYATLPKEIKKDG